MEKNETYNTNDRNFNISKSLKFNTSLLNRPFSSHSNILDVSNISYNDTSIHQSKELKSLSISGFYSNEESNSLISYPTITKHESLVQSQLINKAESSQSKTTRKPFDNISFNKVIKVSDYSTKANEETDLQSLEIVTNITDNTFISEREKSFILKKYKFINDEIINKAKLYNKLLNPHSDSIPFWISFFDEIENNMLHSNSSYYNAKNKELFVSNLIEMVKKDAELYDVTANHQKVKSEVKKNIRSLLITQIEKTNKSYSDHVESITSESSIQDLKIHENLNELQELYNNLDDTEKKLILQNFQISEKSNENDIIAATMKSPIGNKLPNNYNEYEKSKFKVNENIDDSMGPIPKNKICENNNYSNDLIDKINFKENEFDYIDYSAIDLGYYSKSSILKLLEIDKKLNKLNPDVYKTSINTELKQIYKGFLDGKQIREEEFDEKFKKKIEKAKNRIKNSKKSIFETKSDKSEKVKYKDYLQESIIKKERNYKLNKIDDDILNINERSINEEKRKKIYNELDMHHITQCETEEYKLRFQNIKGIFSEQEENLNEMQIRNTSQKNLINDIEKLFANNDHHFTQEQIIQLKLQYEEPYNVLMNEVEKEFTDNKKLMERIEKLENYVNETDLQLQNITEKFSIISKEKKAYEDMWKEADKIFEPFDWSIQ